MGQCAQCTLKVNLLWFNYDNVYKQEILGLSGDFFKINYFSAYKLPYLSYCHFFKLWIKKKFFIVQANLKT